MNQLRILKQVVVFLFDSDREGKCHEERSCFDERRTVIFQDSFELHSLPISHYVVREQHIHSRIGSIS